MTSMTAPFAVPRSRRSTATRTSASRISTLFAVFFIIIYEGAFTSSIRYFSGQPQLSPGTTDWINTLPQAAIMAGILVFLIRFWRPIVPLLRPLLPYILILVLCMLSALWSPYPMVTLRRTASLSVCWGCGIYCYLMFGLEGTIRLLGKTTAVLALLSLIACLVVPSVGFETAEGYENAMRGVFSQKNNLGTAMVLGISCYLYDSLRQGQLFRLSPCLAILLMLACIVLSNSATSLLVVLLVIAIAMGLVIARTVPKSIVIFTTSVVVMLFAYVVIFAPGLLFALISRDATFTGRLPLWQLSLDAARDHLWFGYGYYAFWNEGSVWARYIWTIIAWEAPSAHNGYIEAVLEIGLVGLSLYVWVWGRVIGLAVAAVRHGRFPMASWILLYMGIIGLLNLDEGTLPYPDQFSLLMPGIICFLEAWRSQHLSLRRRQASHRASLRHPKTMPADAAVWQPTLT